MRHTVENEGINALVEDSLFYLKGQRGFGQKRERLLKIVTGLEEAGRIDLERAQNRVARARVELRDAEAECSRVAETNGHEAEVLAELTVLGQQEEQHVAEGERQISLDAKAVGFAYGREELLRQGGLKAIVADRKRKHPELSVAEVEAI